MRQEILRNDTESPLGSEKSFILGYEDEDNIVFKNKSKIKEEKYDS